MYGDLSSDWSTYIKASLVSLWVSLCPSAGTRGTNIVRSLDPIGQSAPLSLSVLQVPMELLSHRTRHLKRAPKVNLCPIRACVHFARTVCNLCVYINYTDTDTHTQQQQPQQPLNPKEKESRGSEEEAQ